MVCFSAHMMQAAASFKVMDGVRVDGLQRSIHTAKVLFACQQQGEKEREQCK